VDSYSLIVTALSSRQYPALRAQANSRHRIGLFHFCVAWAIEPHTIGSSTGTVFLARACYTPCA